MRIFILPVAGMIDSGAKLVKKTQPFAWNDTKE